MEAKLLRRIQRYGWDLAARAYEPLWQAQLAPAQAMLLEWAALAPGQRVLDVACGTGLVSFPAARAVGQQGALLGVDLSEKMVAVAQARVAKERMGNLTFARMDAEALVLPDAGFDVVLCALGLMYMPDPEQALREIWRALWMVGGISDRGRRGCQRGVPDVFSPLPRRHPDTRPDGCAVRRCPALPDSHQLALRRCAAGLRCRICGRADGPGLVALRRTGAPARVYGLSGGDRALA
jgi:SAM-dependent methyltransferase